MISNHLNLGDVGRSEDGRHLNISVGMRKMMINHGIWGYRVFTQTHRLHRFDAVKNPGKSPVVAIQYGTTQDQWRTGVFSESPPNCIIVDI